MLLQFLPVLASKKQTTLVLIDSHHSLTIGSKQTGRNAFGAGETQNLLGAARIPHAHYPFTPEANLLLSGENARALIDSKEQIRGFFLAKKTSTWIIPLFPFPTRRY